MPFVTIKIAGVGTLRAMISYYGGEVALDSFLDEEKRRAE